MKNNFQNDLQNGQTVAEISRLRKRLAKDPAAVLSACSHTDEWERRLGDFRSVFKTHLIQIDSILQSLEAHARICVQQLPIPSGFFVDVEIRKKAALCVSYFLSYSEHSIKELREKSLSLAHLKEDFKQAHYRCFSEERRCALTVEAAKDTVTLQELKSLQDKVAILSSCTKAFEALLAEISKLYSLLQFFCQNTILNFNIRVEKHADLAHGGQKCEPSGLRTVLGELLHVCQRLRAEMSEIQM